MKSREIKTGETYMFVATDAPARKALEGQPFTVVEIKSVWRRRFKQSRRVKRFFNEDGVGARADELEFMDGMEKLGEACQKIADGFRLAGEAAEKLGSSSVKADFNSAPPETVTSVLCLKCGWIGEPNDLAIDDPGNTDLTWEVCPKCKGEIQVS